MKEKYNFDYKVLHPFKWYIIENFPFLEDSIDALTNYELFCKLGKEINKQIDNINTLGVQVEGLTDWFDNLDVQEEINNKLDEMAESGQLQEIISQYLNSTAVFGFDNVESMKNATNLIDGSYAKTLGYYEKNDGGSSLYKIRKITNDDVIDEKFIIEMNDEQNELIAELIYGDEIKVEQVGAYGDGTHDDTEAIQAAINKNKVTILSKTYKITNSLNVDVGYNKGIKGNGIAKILSDFTSRVFDGFKLTNSLYGEPLTGNYGTARDFIIQNLILSEINEAHDTYATHYGSGLCLGNGCNNLKFDNIIISNYMYAIVVPSSSQGVYLNKFTNIKTNNNDYGFYINSTAVNDSGENISFSQCCFATSKLGNYISSDMYVNFDQCSFDYNLGNTFHFKDGSNTTLTNCHIEWYHSTPLINIEYNASVKFIGCNFIKSSYDDSGSYDKMIQVSVSDGLPEIIFEACSFLMGGPSYTNLTNGLPFIKFNNCSRIETSTTNYITNGYDVLNCSEANKYLYPLNFDSGLTRNQTKIKVTATTQNSNNRLYVPLEYNNKDAKITLRVNSSININMNIYTGSGKFLGENITNYEGAIAKNVDLTAGSDTTIVIYHKFRKGFSYKPYLRFDLGNLTQGATFEVKEIGLQII